MGAAQITAVPISVAQQVRLETIVFATDFSKVSQAALPYVAAIAKRYGSEVHLVHIWSPISVAMATREDGGYLLGEIDFYSRTALERIASDPVLAGVTTKLNVAGGDVVDELKSLVADVGADLLVLATHGRTGVKHMVMGSTAENLWRHLPCPVLTIGPHCIPSDGFNLDCIVVPTDLTANSRSVLRYVSAIAKDNNASILGVHVLPLIAKSSTEHAPEVKPLIAEMEKSFSAELSPHCHARFLVEYGDPAEAVLQVARRHSADLIAMSVRERARLATHFRNTTAYGIAVQATCPVLTCRAE